MQNQARVAEGCDVRQRPRGKDEHSDLADRCLARCIDGPSTVASSSMQNARMESTPGYRKQLTVAGLVGVCSALLGLLSWVAYGAFATRAIYAVPSQQPEVAHRMASYADGFRFAQLLLGSLSIGLGWIAHARAEHSRLARILGASAIGLGVLVLALLMLLV